MSRTFRKKRIYGSKVDIEIRRDKSNPYKSSLEFKVAKECLYEYLYEPKESKVEYTVNHTYNPDFVHLHQPNILIEVKGYFIKGSADCQKYLSIIRDNPDKELVFIFSDPSKRCYPGCKMRKDGTYLSLGEWAYKNRILYFTVDDFPDKLRRGEITIEELREMKRRIYEEV